MEGSPISNLGQRMKVYGDFADSEMRFRLGAAANKLQKDIHADEMGMRDKYLGLGWDKYKFERKLGKKQAKNFRDDLLMTKIFGLGTAGLSAKIGYDRAQEERAFNQERTSTLDRLARQLEADALKKQSDQERLRAYYLSLVK